MVDVGGKGKSLTNYRTESSKKKNVIYTHHHLFLSPTTLLSHKKGQMFDWETFLFFHSGNQDKASSVMCAFNIFSTSVSLCFSSWRHLSVMWRPQTAPLYV